MSVTTRDVEATAIDATSSASHSSAAAKKTRRSGPGFFTWLFRVLGQLLLAVLFAAGILGLMIWLSGAFEAKVPTDRTMAVAVPPQIEEGEFDIVEVRRIERPQVETAVGTVRAAHEVSVASKILARVEEVNILAGQAVRKGDVLMRLDKADLEARLEQAKAGEAAAEARAAQARADFARAERLRANQAIPRDQYEAAATALKAAEADLERMRRTVKEASIIEDYALIRAPISGVIVDKLVNVGDTVTPGQPIATLYDPTRMQMVATVRESLAQRLKVGQTIPARLDALGYECQAVISEIVPEAQAESRSFQVKVTGECPPNVYSGMFGRILIPLDHESVTVVPESAVRRVGQLDQVDVVEEDGAIRRRIVRLGRSFGEDREVLSGLVPGERVRARKTTPIAPPDRIQKIQAIAEPMPHQNQNGNPSNSAASADSVASTPESEVAP